MRKMVAEAIKRIYVQRDIGFVKSLQAKVLNGIQLPELQAFAETNNLRIRQLHVLPEGEEEEEEKEEDQPLYWEWVIGFDVEKGAFQAEYGSNIRISAAVPVFSIGHGANLENNLPDPKERMDLDFGGESEEPLTRVQAELHEILKRAGYVQLSDAEMEECVHFLRWEDEVTHVEGRNLRPVGANVTVEDCLFNLHRDPLFTLKHARVVERNEPLDIAPGLAEVVERVYRQGDEAFFREQCQKPCEIPEPVRVYARENGIRVEERSQVGGPGCQWTFHYPEYVNREFRVRFTTKVWVSKLAPVFCFWHASEVDNRAPDAITPVLKGESWDEKIKLQWYLFRDRLRPLLEEMGYEDIDGISQTACVHWLEWKQPGEHGENVTVEDCLFRDIRSQVQFRRSMGI